MNGMILYSWVLYSPSGGTVCFSPYYRDPLELDVNVKAFLFNFNHPQIIIVDIDGKVSPNFESEELPEKYYCELYKRVIATPLSITPEKPKAKHLKLVTEDFQPETE